MAESSPGRRDAAAFADRERAAVPARSAWTFITNHAHVLLCVARDPSMRLRDVATTVGITERAAQSIVADLVTAGYLTRRREGRRNRYEVHLDAPLRPHDNASLTVGGLLAFLQSVTPTVDYPTVQVGAARRNEAN